VTIFPNCDQPRRIAKSLGFAVLRKDAAKKQIWGWASVSTVDGVPVTDVQGDRISTDVLEKAVYSYVANSGNIGDMHARLGAGKCIESFVFTKSKCASLGIPVPEGKEGWFIGIQCDDQLWAQVLNGNTNLSIGGSARRKAVNND
jgi:hypothetical protein